MLLYGLFLDQLNARDQARPKGRNRLRRYMRPDSAVVNRLQYGAIV